MNTMKIKENTILTKNDLIKVFEQGCKDPIDFKTGIEYERILINKNTYQTVPYQGDKGIYRLLRQIAFKDEWSYISEFGQVTGLRKGNNTITLEPGGQLELSLSPKKTILESKKEIQKIDNKIISIADSLDIQFINYGISPLTTKKDIELIPKRRYAIMAKNLSGKNHDNMMRETAGIQTSIDYSSEEDASKKLKLSLMLSPIMTAMFANSPVYEGKLCGYKSYRALAWLHTDSTRCGFISRKIFDKGYRFSFNDYVDVILAVPLLFIVRDNELIEINQKIDFKTFMEEGFEGYNATIEDFLLHANIFFPEARLNNYIEIRNHDSQKWDLKYSIPAIYKGIFRTDSSIDEALDLLKNISYEDFSIAREKVPGLALKANLGSHKISDLAKEVLKIANTSLIDEGKNEEKFLEPIRELTENEKCPADIIIQNWHSVWNANFNYFINYITEDYKA